MNRNAHNKEEKGCCYFHPKQVVVGVCPLCLNERLLILAAKQDHHNHHHRLQSSTQRKASASIHKIFAFGSLFTRHQLKSHNYYDQDDASPSPEGKTLFYSLMPAFSIIYYMSVSNKVSRKNAPTKFDYEPSSNFDKIDHMDAEVDSFISMKFEENGVASWEKSTSTNAISNISNKKVCVERQVLDKDAKESKSVVEHGKSNNAFRWRKRIGRLVHFIPWKRSNKGGGVGHVEGVKVNRKGWMRTLTKRKTVEQKG
ncbi:hypothetical protein JHK87_035547 [Glycine soja]|nr:hypothetical protein JHK87_035547 [Glycine soja]